MILAIFGDYAELRNSSVIQIEKIFFR